MGVFVILLHLNKIKMKKIKVLFGLFIISASLSGQTRSFGEKIEEGSIIENFKIQNLFLAKEKFNAKLKADPVTGEIGELGFGTQDLPVSGRDIQDEKVLGTLHVATGRSDHLGGHLTPDLFAEKLHATHDDILFSPSKTPEIRVTQARMSRGGETTVVIENFEPSSYLRNALAE